MSKQTKIPFGSGSGAGAAGAKRKPPQQGTATQQNLAELDRLFGEDNAASAAAAPSAASAPVAASAAASSSSSSDGGVRLSRDDIRSVFHARHEDMQKALDDLIETTGRHKHLHSRFVDDTQPTHADGSSSSPSLKKQRSGRLTFEQKTGDLFSCESSSALVHCVSTCMAMGKGIATLFKNKFGGVAELKAQNKQVGEVAILKREGRFIYYLTTKPRYFDKPTYASLEKSLIAMRLHMLDHGVKVVSMPRIGCGLDGLIWHQVADIIKKVFANVDCKIVVYTM